MSIQIETARDMMTHPAFTLNADGDIYEAMVTLIDKHIHGAPVVDDDRQLLGIVSDTDLTRVVAAAAFHRLPTGPVREHMTAEVVSVDVDDDIYAISGIFERGEASRLPVLEGGRVVGIITRRNLLKALQRLAKVHDRGASSTYDLLSKLLGRANPLRGD